MFNYRQLLVCKSPLKPSNRSSGIVILFRVFGFSAVLLSRVPMTFTVAQHKVMGDGLVWFLYVLGWLAFTLNAPFSRNTDILEVFEAVMQGVFIQDINFSLPGVKVVSIVKRLLLCSLKENTADVPALSYIAAKVLFLIEITLRTQSATRVPLWIFLITQYSPAIFVFNVIDRSFTPSLTLASVTTSNGFV